MEKIIEDKCQLKKENLGIRLYSYNFNKKEKYTEVINPKELDSLILIRPSTISTDIFKLNPNIQVTIFNNGNPTHLIYPINSTPKIIKNYIKLNNLSSFKKKKLGYVFCKGVCSNRIKVLSRLNEIRKNKFVSNTLKEMRILDRKLIKCKNKKEMMGLEGNIAKKFYIALNELNPQFESKRIRNSRDLSNILMNFYRTLLRTKITLRLNSFNIPLNYGFLHEKKDRNQPYLVWDFAGLWIPYIDKLVFYTIERQIIKEEDILENGRLKNDAIKKAVNLINARISNEDIDNKINQFLNYVESKGRFNWKI
jgi:CRISPR-associated endonuclease Cas1